MVRGRRVRAVMTCHKPDDCCSPHPKRKDQKGAAKPAATHTITEFFQVCDLELAATKKNARDKIVLEAEKIYEFEPTTNNGLSYRNNINCPATPKLAAIKSTSLLQHPKSPHRIELRTDAAKGGAPKEERDEQEQVVPKLPKLPAVVRQKENAPGNAKVTDFLPVRRSVRKTKKIVLEEKQRLVERAVRNGVEDGLQATVFEGKGRGVVATRRFERGDFVVEYAGELIDPLEAQLREERYSLDKAAGCYMYYFKHNEQQYCIDATAESGRLGRLVNHSRNGNLGTRTVMVDGKPRLVLIAREDIAAGAEVLYDYGDRSKESLKHHPWLAY